MNNLTFRQSDAVVSLVEGHDLMLPPYIRVTRRSSRLMARTLEGKVYLEPLIHVLAKTFHAWDPKAKPKRVPMWRDGDWTNESEENVELVLEGAVGRPRGSGKIPFPAGTYEYRKAYREANRAKYQAAAKKYYAKKRRMERLGEALLSGDLKDVQSQSVDALEKLLKGLE